MKKQANQNCKWSCYGRKCGHRFTNVDGFCEEHAKLKCWCGKQSTTGCPHAGQFVCGSQLCEDHKDACPAHGGDKPKPKCKACGQEIKE